LQSAKLRCLSSLLPSLVARGHRTLIFSQGINMMDLVELCILRKQGIEYLRIDGKTPIASRKEKIKSFQVERERYKCMLLTTRVGGYGLNLTGADRVILIDPAWNPAADMQAVDRAHRIGQDREVRTYRLVMSGLIEDKMFRLQVFKMGLIRTALEAKQTHRYFTSNEIRGLFQWVDPRKGETRRLLAEKHGVDEDKAVEKKAKQDGADEGWLKAGPSVGLSNFATLFSSLAQDMEEPEEECSAEVKEMKDKLARAEQEATRAADVRQSVASRIEGAQKGAEEAVQQISAAAKARAKAAERLKQSQTELTQAQRKEAAAESLTEKAAQAQSAAEKHRFTADEARLSAEHAVPAIEAQVKQTGDVAALAEQGLLNSLVDVDSKLALVDGSSVAGAPSSALTAAKKSFDRVRKAFEAAKSSRVSTTEAVEDAIKTESCFVQAEVGVTIASKYGDHDDATAPRTAQAAMKVADKERARAEKALEKAQERAKDAHENAAAMLPDLREVWGSLAESLYGATDGVLQRDVKSVAQDVKSSIRNLCAAWQSVKSAFDSCNKATALRRKSARGQAVAAAGCSEAHARILCADTACKHAAAEAAACAARRVSCEANLENARAASLAVSTEEVGLKRKRDECKVSLAEAKMSLKSARMVEKEAATGRDAVYKHYSKAGEIVKDELAAVKSSAEEQAKALSAIQALKEEAYDANQVVVAYEAKKKPPRPEEEQ